MSQSCRMVSMVLYFYYITMIIYILYYLVFKILSSFVRDSSYHDMYYKGCGLLCAHKKSFNIAIPIRSLGPYMYVHYFTCIVHILVWTYLFLLTSFFDYLSFCGLFSKHPFKDFFLFIFFIFTYRDLSPLLLYETSEPVFNTHISAALTAGAIGSFVGTPAEISLIRMTAGIVYIVLTIINGIFCGTRFIKS